MEDMYSDVEFSRKLHI